MKNWYMTVFHMALVFFSLGSAIQAPDGREISIACAIIILLFRIVVLLGDISDKLDKEN